MFFNGLFICFKLLQRSRLTGRIHSAQQRQLLLLLAAALPQH
jgi:hypothetical protein